MNTALSCRLALIALGLFSIPCFSQTAETKFASTMWELLSDSLSVGSPGQPDTLILLSPSIPIKSLVAVPLETPPYLWVADMRAPWRCFTSSETVEEIRTTPLTILKAIAPQIQPLEFPLSEADSLRIKKAKAVLYTNGTGGAHAPLYEQYLHYKEAIDDLKQAAAAAGSDTERAAIRDQIQQKEEDWPNVPAKINIEKALADIKALASSSTQDVTKWKTTISQSKGADVGGVWTGLSERSGWITITTNATHTTTTSSSQFTAPLADLSVITIRKKGNTPLLKQPLTGLTGMQLTLKRATVARDYIDENLLTNRNWTIGGGKYLSDGAATVQDQASELIPRIVSQLVLAKNIELYFKNPDALKTIADLLQNDDNVEVRIGTLYLKHPNMSESVYYPNTITIPQAQIIALIAKELPKAPSATP